MLVIVMGPSASGKDTLVNEIIKNSKGRYSKLISTTSRPMRDGETEGVEYYFVTQEKFKAKLENRRIVESRCYETLVDGKPDVWYYGTEVFGPSLDLRFCIKDPMGAAALAKHCELIGEPYAFIEVKCPEKTRTKRAEKRGSFDESEWNRRLEADKKDFKNVRKTLTENGVDLKFCDYIEFNSIKDNSNDLVWRYSLHHNLGSRTALFDLDDPADISMEENLIKWIRENTHGAVGDFVEALEDVGYCRKWITAYLLGVENLSGADVLRAYERIN